MSKSEEKYMRKVQTASLVFIYHGDEFLFLKRGEHKRVDPGKLNGVGGRVDPGEDFLTAAIRETEEETGYKIDSENFRFCGFVRLEGGYSEDWLSGIFKAEVESKKIPVGTKTDDGELLWLHKDKVLDSEYELIDDLNYFWKNMLIDDEIFFANATMNKDEKVEKMNMSVMKV